MQVLSLAGSGGAVGLARVRIVSASSRPRKRGVNVVGTVDLYSEVED